MVINQGNPYYRPNHHATEGIHWRQVFTDDIATFSRIKINIVMFSLRPRCCPRVSLSRKRDTFSIPLPFNQIIYFFYFHCFLVLYCTVWIVFLILFKKQCVHWLPTMFGGKNVSWGILGGGDYPVKAFYNIPAMA